MSSGWRARRCSSATSAWSISCTAASVVPLRRPPLAQSQVVQREYSMIETTGIASATTMPTPSAVEERSAWCWAQARITGTSTIAAAASPRATAAIQN